MRDHCNFEELSAHALLDMVALGFEEVPEADILRALWILGDAVGCK